jgi:hypothetical protein
MNTNRVCGLPTPNTVCVRVVHNSGHRMQVRTCSRMTASAAFRSAGGNGLPGATDCRATIGSASLEAAAARAPAVRASAVGAAAARELAAVSFVDAAFPFPRLFGTLVTPARFKLSKRCRTILRASAMSVLDSEFSSRAHALSRFFSLSVSDEGIKR